MQETAPAEFEALRNRRCNALLIRERAVAGECRGECEAVDLQLDDDRWIALTPDRARAAYLIKDSDAVQAQRAFSDGEFYYPIYDAGALRRLNGLRTDRAWQQCLGDRLELCLEFSNATDLTVHYDLVTGGSSRYFIND